MDLGEKNYLFGYGGCHLFMFCRCNIMSSAEEASRAIITKSGVLRKRKPNIYYVDSYQKRYIPAKNDSVIGVVQTKTLDFFWVDINASEPAGKTSCTCKDPLV